MQNNVGHVNKTTPMRPSVAWCGGKVMASESKIHLWMVRMKANCRHKRVC